MTAVTERVSAIWIAFHGRVRVVPPTLVMSNKEHNIEMGVQRERCPSTWHDIRSSITIEEPQIRRLWRLDSDVEGNLDEISMRKPSPELDLSVRPRTVRVCEDNNTMQTMAPSQRPITGDRVSRDPNLARRNDKSRKGRAVSTETNPRYTVKRTDGERQHAPQSSGEGLASRDRRNGRRT